MVVEHLADHEIEELVGGALEGMQLERAEVHLDRCARCREVVAAVARASHHASQSPRIDWAAMPDLPRGSAVGRHVILERIGKGGMGVVYSAYDSDLDRKIALKFLKMSTGDEGREAKAMLQREAQAMAKVAHPNVVRVYEIGSMGDAVFVAMELIEGDTLAEWVSGHERSPEEILEVYCAAGEGLVAAHGAGVVHGDFKPENVLVGTDGRVCVTDFGLAQRLAEDRRELDEVRETIPPPMGALNQLTVTRAIVGTPAYMAPEQFERRAASARSDQFSFCVALYEALCKTRPYAGTTIEELRAALRDSSVVDCATLPRALRAPLLRGLRVREEERFGSMDELLLALRPRSTKKSAALIAGTAVAAVAMTAVLALLPGRVPSSLCTGGDARIAEVWSSSRKSKIPLAQLQGAFAAETWTHLSEALDRYAASWSLVHRRACEATRVHGEQSEELLDQRMYCLERRLGELSAFAGYLETASPEVMPRLLQAAHGLTPANVCSDLELVRSGGQLAADPEVRAQVEMLQTAQNQAKAMGGAGEYARALEHMQKAMAEAPRALEHGPAEAEAFLEMGEEQKKLGDHKSAGESLKRAVWAGQRSGHDWAVAAAAGSLVGVSRALDDVAMADHWLAHADAAIARLGGNKVFEAELAISRGNLHWARDQYDEAIAAYHEALDAYRAASPEDPDVAYVYHNLAMVHSVQGKVDEAIALNEKALEIRRDKLGALHPVTAESLHSLGNNHQRKKDYDRAISYYQQAIDILESSQGPDSPVLADFLGNLGAALAASSKYEEAIVILQRSLVIQEQVHGPEHSDLGYAHVNLGDLAMMRKRPDEAEAPYRRALAIWEKTLGADHSLLAYPLTGLGEVLLEKARATEALPLLERAHAIRQATPGPDAYKARTAFALAKTLWTLGQRGRAKSLVELAETLAADDDAAARGIRQWRQGTVK